MVFGEDVAQKGGVYTVTKGLWKRFGPARVFNTLLDETTILGLAQGFGTLGFLPIPEIQYLAYFHNACDQIRGEACSLQFFSNGQFRNPMVMRIASLGYQRGFGGHFHNDNSIAALRDIPGLVVGCPSRGDDAVRMLRTMMALARVDGRVCAFLEPIALYMTKDLHAPEDGLWQFPYPPEGEALAPGEGRVYHPEARELLVVTFGNGVPMALRCARRLGEEGIGVRVLDLRWLVPLERAADRAAGGRVRARCWCSTRAAAAAGWGRASSPRSSRAAWAGVRSRGSAAPTPTRRSPAAAFLVLPDEAQVLADGAPAARPLSGLLFPARLLPIIVAMSRSEPMSIVFADVSGSTRLFEQKGDVEARQIIAKVLGALAEVTTRHGGRVIKTIGDEIMCVFPTAIQGVHAAIEMQRRLARDPEFARDKLAVRIGLHHGEALVEEGDVFGDAVNTAARMVELAKREQIVATASSLRDLTGSTQLRTRSLGRARVAGKLFPVEICDVLWQEDLAEVTMVQRAVRLDDGGTVGVKLTIRHRGRLVELNEDSPPFTMGRDPGNQLVVDAEWVSRFHALIEYKKGYFVLTDRSTNGTYVRLGEDDELRLHRDEMHLRKSGAVSMGQPIGLNFQDVVYFQCDYGAGR
ncbi:MAG: adenylate/guanylate cyclase domain-containing protein [Xanthomonadales bacterium]|nr:adenylate/guanylate cyclase domain-containing protein [Xanthomonadales bacterium]